MPRSQKKATVGQPKRIKRTTNALEKFWGTGSNLACQLAAITAVLLLLAGIVYTFVFAAHRQDSLVFSVKDFWQIIFPVITLSLGYLFRDLRTRKTDTHEE